jgi:hypothetical protein
VLSNGHASMLLYSVLHLTGYPLSMDEIRNFRQFGSKTAGHPEREVHLGIETTTGPLGQGISPMPWAWRWRSARWRPPSTGPATPSSITTPTFSAATAA